MALLSAIMYHRFNSIVELFIMVYRWMHGCLLYDAFQVGSISYDYATRMEPFWMGTALALTACCFCFLMLQLQRNVYLVDFSIYQPPEDLRVPHQVFVDKSKLVGRFTDHSIAFQAKILERSGLGQNTYFPPSIMKDPTDLTMEGARKGFLCVAAHGSNLISSEFLLVVEGCMEDLLRRTAISPTDIDFVVVNCSLFNVTPSLTSIVRSSYNVG